MSKDGNINVEAIAYPNDVFKVSWKNSAVREVLRNCDVSDLQFIYTSLSNGPPNAIPTTDKWGYWFFDPACDLFGGLSDEQKDRLRTCHKTYLILDFSYEANPTYAVVSSIHHSCEKHNIPEYKILYTTGDGSATSDYQQYQLDHPDKPPIRVSTLLTWKWRTRAIFAASNDVNASEKIHLNDLNDVNEAYEYYKKLTIEKYNGKYFASLSRKNRPWRSFLQFLLTTDDYLSGRGAISQNVLSEKSINLTTAKIPAIDRAALIAWNKTLPRIADYADFSVHFNNLVTIGIYASTLFSVAAEPHYIREQRFLSEKAFRPMFAMQPVITVGQPEVNKYYHTVDLKTYDDWFDYSFDDEQDPVKRLHMIKDEVTRVSKMLDNMTREEQINWRFKNPEVLRHNYKEMVSINHELKVLKPLIMQIKDEANGKGRI